MKQTRKKSKVFAVALILLAVVGGTLLAGGMPTMDPTIVGEWRWTGASTPVGQLGPLAGQTYIVTLREDGTMTMAFEDNTVNGSYTAISAILSIEPEAAPNASWLPGSSAPRLIELLAEPRGYVISDDGALKIENMNGAGSIDFERIN